MPQEPSGGREIEFKEPMHFSPFWDNWCWFFFLLCYPHLVVGVTQARPTSDHSEKPAHSLEISLLGLRLVIRKFHYLQGVLTSVSEASRDIVWPHCSSWMVTYWKAPVALRIVSFPLRHNEGISDFDLLGVGGDGCTVAFVGLLQLGKESRDKLQNCQWDQVSVGI